MTPVRTSMSSKIRSSARPAVKHLRRVGWLAEDGMDAGLKMARTHPRKFGALIVGVAILTAGVVWACRSQR